MSFEVDQLTERAIEAIDREIEAVRERPSHDVLYDGERVYDGEQGYYYRFETQNSSIQYAEVIRAKPDGDSDEIEIQPVQMEEGQITLLFPKDRGEQIDRVELEWENDFVLLKVRDELLRVKQEDEATEDRLAALFDPQPERDAACYSETEVEDGGRLNDSQHEALEKALKNRSLFVWGPPGTGKTATLGYIAANYLNSDKKVLLASNTNRAVDVGLINALEACEAIGAASGTDRVVRFGEPALQDPRVDAHTFEQQLQLKAEKQEQKAARLDERLQQYYQLEQQLSDMDPDDPDADEMERNYELIHQRLEAEGGEEAVKDQIDQLQQVNERVELEKRDLVATTLARVCTSELFRDLEFDAVIVDEGSMANLPYLIALARKAREHVVVVGDPMQLPPIALTSHRASKQFLERDIFGWISGASTTDDLFRWHDNNRSLTCFFEEQYRLKAGLAQLVSSVFYQGRLKSADSAEREEPRDSTGREREKIALLDSSRYDPEITKNKERRGFSPFNKVHQFILQRLIQQKVLKEQVRMQEIGVIVPFRSAVYDYRNKLTAEGYRDVEVGTIHTFQGREKRVIIFDTVMSGERIGSRSRHYTVRPFDETKNGLTVPRLLNVALSRCKEQLYVIADMDHIEHMYGDKFLGRLLRRIREEGEDLLQSKSPIS